MHLTWAVAMHTRSERERGESEEGRESALDLARRNPHEQRQPNIEQYEGGKKESGDKSRQAHRHPRFLPPPHPRFLRPASCHHHGALIHQDGDTSIAPIYVSSYWYMRYVSSYWYMTCGWEVDLQGGWRVPHTLALLSELLGRCCGGLVAAGLALLEQLLTPQLPLLLTPPLPLLQHLRPNPSNNQTHDKDGAEGAIEEADHLRPSQVYIRV